MGASDVAAPGALTRSWVVQPGEGLTAALGRLYLTPSVARAVVDAYATVRAPTKLQAGWRLWGRFDGAGVMDAGGLATLVVAPQHGEGVTVERAPGGGYEAREGGLPGTLVRTALRCGVIGSLESSLRRCGEGDGLALAVGAVLGERLAEEIAPRTGDELRLVVDKLMDGEQLLRYHRLVALQWRAAVAGDRVTAFWFAPTHSTAAAGGAGTPGPTRGAYFAADGQSLESLFLRQPLRSGHTTSTFGMRLHPILHKLKAHYGVDFGAARGTPVFAAADGVLTAVGRAGAAGNLVRLRHDSGWATEYMHLQKFALGVRAGERVGKGETIGFVGTTGRSTGPHLHFGVRRNGRYVDPQSVEDELRAPVPAHDRREFDRLTHSLGALIDGLDREPGSGS
ncbi:MAG: M23 family metallopeptidase [Myxococcales bacterium]|nr:M23 family metallopeptidase [Myxococcales bacterium]